VFALAGCGGASMSAKVGSVTGQPVKCSKGGVIFLAGAQETFFICRTDDENATVVGCYVNAKDGIYDVTKQARAIFELQGASQQPCG
jgi:hypothetical protein